MEIEVIGGTISPGDMVIVSSSYGVFDIGFYRGKGNGTIQYYTIRGLTYAVEKKMRKYPWPVSHIGGDRIERRVMRYSPDLITNAEDRKELEMAIEFIRETNILPVKY